MNHNYEAKQSIEVNCKSDEIEPGPGTGPSFDVQHSTFILILRAILLDGQGKD